MSVVDFLNGKSTDAEGRLIHEIWLFGQKDLEAVHNYIQWLFPLSTPSNYNSSAPVLTNQEIETIRSSPSCMASIAKSADIMISFYEKTDHWAKEGDHNLLRITRILKSCSILLGHEYSRDVYDRIARRCKALNFKPSSVTAKFWIAATKGN